MSLTRQLSEYIAACFTGIWVQSHEHDDAIAEIARLCHEQQWRLAVWDIEQGLQIPGRGESAEAGGTDPLAAIRSINTLAAPNSSALLVLANFHRFLNSAETVQALARQITAGKQNRTFIIVLSPVLQLPTELEKQFVVLLGSLVGQSEQNIRQALQIADAMAPCVLFCDEIGKALSGVASSGQTDSGVSARLFGNLLTWLNDHESDVFFVAIVHADVDDDFGDEQANEVHALFGAIQHGVTDWGRQTDEGQRGLCGNNFDFNVGDLGEWSGDGSLAKFLRQQGIRGFRVECHCDTSGHCWDYDDRLFDEDIA